MVNIQANLLRQFRRTFASSTTLLDVPKAPEFHTGRLEGTVQHHRCYVLLHSSEPPSVFPKVMQTPLSRELSVRASKWGGLVNFAWLKDQRDTHSSLNQPATVFSHLGGRLEIPDVSLTNIDDVEGLITRHLEGPVTESTSKTASIFVCTHGARDCRCGDRGQQVYEALVQAVCDEQQRDPSGPSRNIQVGAVGHVGGHQYAANVLIFPHGEWLGTVKPEDASSIVARLCEDLRRNIKPLGKQAEPFSLVHWRGRMGLTKEEQQSLYAAST